MHIDASGLSVCPPGYQIQHTNANIHKTVFSNHHKRNILHICIPITKKLKVINMKQDQLLPVP